MTITRHFIFVITVDSVSSVIPPRWVMKIYFITVDKKKDLVKIAVEKGPEEQSRGMEIPSKVLCTYHAHASSSSSRHLYLQTWVFLSSTY